nr:MAG TPA: hypothetical protein [Caudoviricetes sp.]
MSLLENQSLSMMLNLYLVVLSFIHLEKFGIIFLTIYGMQNLMEKLV